MTKMFEKAHNYMLENPQMICDKIMKANTIWIGVDNSKTHYSSMPSMACSIYKYMLENLQDFYTEGNMELLHEMYKALHVTCFKDCDSENNMCVSMILHIPHTNYQKFYDTIKNDINPVQWKS